MTATVLRDMRPRSRPDLLVGPPVLRGRAEIHPVKDPVSGRRFELRAKEHFVLSRLDGVRTLDEIGEEYARRFGARLGDTHWQQLLGLLHARRLLAGDQRPPEPAAPRPADDPAPARSTLFSGRTRLVADAGALIEGLHRRTGFARTRLFLGSLLALSTVMLVQLGTESGMLRHDLTELHRRPVLLLAVGVVLWVSLALHELAHGLVGRAFGGTVSEIGLRWRLPATYLYCLVQDVPFFARRRHQMATAAAGPAMNVVFLLPFWPVWMLLPEEDPAHYALGGMMLLGCAIAAANLLPLPPLDGYKLLGYGLGASRLATDSRTFLRESTAALFRPGEGARTYPVRARVVYAGYGLATGALTVGAAVALLGGCTWFLADHYGTLAALVPVLLLAAAVVLWRLGLAARDRAEREKAARDKASADALADDRPAAAPSARPPTQTPVHPQAREREMTSVEAAPGAAVAIEDVHKRYGPVHAVDGVSLTVRRGEFFGILGPNGAGKTTLIEMVEGLRQADSGSVTVLGSAPWPRNTALLQRMGVQTQSSAFFTRLTAMEHLRTVGMLYGLLPDAADRALRLVGLSDRPDVRVDDLSGGQRQRLAIATALIHDPELILLDEPTAALDPEARRALWGVLRTLKSEGRTIVHTTHHLDEAEALCDRVAIMAEGRIIALDSPANLIRDLKAPTRVLVPADRITVERALAIDGADAAVLDGGEVVIETRSAGRVLIAVGEIAGLDAVQTRTATLEDAYLELTGSEHRL